MYEIIDNRNLGPNLTEYRILAPRIAQARQCGQFVMVRACPHSERIPLTVAQTDPEAGTITLIVQTVGKSTREMAEKVAEALDVSASNAGVLVHRARKRLKARLGSKLPGTLR